MLISFSEFTNNNNNRNNNSNNNNNNIITCCVCVFIYIICIYHELPVSKYLHLAFQHLPRAARPPEPVKALEMPPEDRGGDSAPPSFRPDGTTGTTAGNETTSMHLG
jgi:hypothetical protein